MLSAFTVTFFTIPSFKSSLPKLWKGSSRCTIPQIQSTVHSQEFSNTLESRHLCQSGWLFQHGKHSLCEKEIVSNRLMSRLNVSHCRLKAGCVDKGTALVQVFADVLESTGPCSGTEVLWIAAMMHFLSSYSGYFTATYLCSSSLVL